MGETPPEDGPDTDEDPFEDDTIPDTDGTPPDDVIEPATDDPFDSVADPSDADSDDPLEDLDDGPDAGAADPFDDLADGPGAGADNPFEDLDDVPDTDIDDPFEEMEMPDLDTEAVFEAALEDAADGDGTAHGSGADGVVTKEQYCKKCEHFSEPPETACTNPGTEIVELVGVDSFRVRGCPVLADRQRAESVFPDGE